jgi:hypothetical protein
MWVNQLFYLGALEQLLCTCLPHGFAGVWPVVVLNVSIGGGSLLYDGWQSLSFARLSQIQ